jgi:hypothetical protein
MPSAKLQNAPSGVIVACPISDCEVRQIAGVGVLMRLHYIEKAEQYETGERTTIQILLEPEQALEMQGALKKSMQALEFGKGLKRSLKLLQAPSPESSPVLCQ